MLVNRETDYAIRVILYLAMQPEGTRVSAKRLAVEKVIPKAFTRRILTRLAKAGLLKSLKGLKGGVYLAKMPSQISILEVMEAVGRVPRVSPCIEDPRACPFTSTCPVRELWIDIDKELKEHLRETTFEQLAYRFSKQEEKSPTGSA
ncbi:MAG: Rrf2 family transcriptional regulator [Anaerolineae bacterium]|nr:Rrf2 family transcriptional regulator [Anaerolineae bacterium]MDW8102598.1 Rrf2 family transcriptional regulator [Anaerolineae bacterium]